MNFTTSASRQVVLFHHLARSAPYAAVALTTRILPSLLLAFIASAYDVAEDRRVIAGACFAVASGPPTELAVAGAATTPPP